MGFQWVSCAAWMKTLCRSCSDLMGLRQWGRSWFWEKQRYHSIYAHCYCISLQFVPKAKTRKELETHCSLSLQHFHYLLTLLTSSVNLKIWWCLGSMSVGVCNHLWPSRSISESSLAGDLDMNSKYVITSRWYWHGKPISYPHCKAFRISQELLTNWKIILDQNR